MSNKFYWEALQKLTPCGCQTLSKMPCRYVEGVYPEVLTRGLNGHVWDAEEHEYIDLIAGLGCVSVGYCDAKVDQAITNQLQRGISFSLPNILEAMASLKLCGLLPGTEMWKFTKTGSDADSMASKCARAYTGRDKIMTCGYHGWHDWYAIQNDRKAGIPKFNDTLVTKAYYNNLESFVDLASKQYAAVIMEPMVFEYPNGQFLQAVQRMCKDTGTVFILDEVVTGGKFSTFFAQPFFNVEADLTVASKGIANGMPLAAVGGRKEIMQVFERNDFFASTTFGGECLSLAAFMATSDRLIDSLPDMLNNGMRIKCHFNGLFDKAMCKGHPTRLTFDFPTSEHKAVFMQEMCLQGILVGYSNSVMASHTDNDIERILQAITNTHKTMTTVWDNPAKILRGKLPEETLRLR